MSKTIGLKDLHDTYISSGMTLSELCNYLKLPENTVKDWETYFNLAPKKIKGVEKIYTKDKIQEFIRIKGFVENGRSLKEIREKVYNLPLEVISNPFENTKNYPEFKPEKMNMKISSSSDYAVRPFLSQLHIANKKIGDLIFEKAKIVEDAAIEKADLLGKIAELNGKNEALLQEKQNISAFIQDQKESIEKFSKREDTLAKSLLMSQEMLNKKESEIENLKGKIEVYKQEIVCKDDLIREQSQELDELLEKQSKRWWNLWGIL